MSEFADADTHLHPHHHHQDGPFPSILPTTTRMVPSHASKGVVFPKISHAKELYIIILLAGLLINV